MDEPVFEDRFVAFLDILGFRSHVDQAHRDPKWARLIRNSMRGLAISRSRGASLGAVQSMVAFSDSIVLSSPDPMELIGASMGLHRTLLQIGMLTRGGVAFGPVCHEDAIVFGAAMIEAYRMESELAIYPRVVVSTEAVERMGPLGNALRRDQDGLLSLDLFRDWVNMQDQEFCKEIGKVLFTVLSQSQDASDTRTFQKAAWLCSRFNDALRHYQPEMDPIKLGREPL